MGQGRPAAIKPLSALNADLRLAPPEPPRVAVAPHRPHIAESHHLRIAGLSIEKDASRIRGAIIATEARGLESSTEMLVSGTAELTDDVPAMFHRLRASTQCSATEGAVLAKHIANAAGELINVMLAEASLAPESVLAVGIADPGLWYFEPGAAPGYESICDAAWLAEQTGLNCVDAFPARDLASGGQGGPLFALPQWMLLRDPQKTRVLLDLGRTTQATYLPPTSLRSASSRVLSFDVGPGTILTDRLARHLTNGQYQHDPGGSLAVQGRKIPDLIEHWLSDPYFQEPPPRWFPLGVKPEEELNQTVQMAVEAGWSVRDLLCTATHFIAETVALAINERLPREPHIDEIILSGGGQANGMLLREIAAKVPGETGAPEPAWLRCGSMGWSDDVLDATCAALLGLLHIEQIPANHAVTTGTRTPRVLGRLTPGSPQSWRRLVQHLAATLPKTMSLRAAV